MPELVIWSTLAAALGVTELVFAGRGRRDGPDARASDLLAVSATVVALAVPVILALAGVARSDAVSAIVGCCLATGGIVLRVAAMVGLRGRYRLTPQSEPESPYLVSGGVYAVVRHPGYLALVGVLAGLALVAAGPVGLCALPPVAAAALLRIAGEERILADEFGEEYARYRTRVTWRLVPWLY